jgi:hypothetical protein
MDPSGTEKGAIKLIQQDKTEVIVEARVASWKLDNHLGSMKNTGQMSFKSIDSPVVSHIEAIMVPFSPNDVPSGNIYLVRLEPDKKTGLAWGTNAEGQNVPLKKYVALETSKLKASKVEGGTLIILDVGTVLEPGKYAITIANNKYAWGFIVN